jgi:amino acid transporter
VVSSKAQNSKAQHSGPQGSKPPNAAPEAAGEVTLARGMRLPEVLMQSIGTMCPAGTAIFVLPFIASYAGIAVPGVIWVAMVIMLALAWTLSRIARELPSAGGYYTFVSAAFGPAAGFFIATVTLVYILAPSMNSGYLSTAIVEQVGSYYGVDLPKELFFVAVILITGYLVWRGVAVSGKALLVMGLMEIVIIAALGIFGLVQPGEGGVSLQSLNPLHAGSGLYLGVVFASFFFAGWEAAAPIAEESANPRRTMPRALIGSILLIGGVFIVATWGILSGWGISDITGFAESTQLAPIVVAQKYWGAGWILLLLAVLNSVCAISLATTLVVTRMLYAMARVGVVPAAFAKLHPKHRTPTTGTLVVIGFSLVLGLVAMWTVGAANAYYIYGLLFTLLLIVVYVAGNAAVGRYFYKHKRDQFNVLPDVILPIVTSAILLFIGYKSVVPFPDYPVAAGIWIAAGWLAIGAVLALANRRKAVELESAIESV